MLRRDDGSEYVWLQARTLVSVRGVDASGARLARNEDVSSKRPSGAPAQVRAWKKRLKAERSRPARMPAPGPGKSFGLVRMRAASSFFSFSWPREVPSQPRLADNSPRDAARSFGRTCAECETPSQAHENRAKSNSVVSARTRSLYAVRTRIFYDERARQSGSGF